jgi:hypothetical protein
MEESMSESNGKKRQRRQFSPEDKATICEIVVEHLRPAPIE